MRKTWERIPCPEVATVDAEHTFWDCSNCELHNSRAIAAIMAHSLAAVRTFAKRPTIRRVVVRDTLPASMDTLVQSLECFSLDADQEN